VRRPKPGDRILTFKINVSEVARTNQTKGQHPYRAVFEILGLLLEDMAENPAVTGKSIVWNGVDCGEIKISWKAP
jgi:hypothetical protein